MFGRRRKIISKGQSVYLFAPGKDSADDFLTMTTGSKGFHEPWVFPPTDRHRYKAYLERLEKGNAYGFFIARLDDDSMAGVININDVILGGFLSGSLGYYAAAPYSGRGYMSEGLALVLDYAFTVLDLHRVEANIQPANTASLALVKRLGFRKEGFSPAFLRIDGEWRDHERWAMLNEEWLAAHHQDGAAPVSHISQMV
ncbi:MAG: GNAT family N-acetyltransferase [Rhodospirillaceae bacterium]